MHHIEEVAAELGLSPNDLMFYGDSMAKVCLPVLPDRHAGIRGKIILVSAEKAYSPSIRSPRHIPGSGRPTAMGGAGNYLSRRISYCTLRWRPVSP